MVDLWYYVGWPCDYIYVCAGAEWPQYLEDFPVGRTWSNRYFSVVPDVPEDCNGGYKWRKQNFANGFAVRNGQ